MWFACRRDLYPTQSPPRPLKRYGETPALPGVDLDVPAGTVCALLGRAAPARRPPCASSPPSPTPTRAPRTSRAMTSPQRADQVRRRIGLAAQEATVDGLLTGRENLVMVGGLHHSPARPRPRAEELLEQFPSPTPATGSPATTPAACAAGSTWRRRSSPARTCSSSTSRRRAWTRGRATSCGTCSTAVGEGATLLLTTQYLEEADRLAHEIVVVDHGRVIARGDARTLKRQIGGDQLQVVPAGRRPRPRGRDGGARAGAAVRSTPAGRHRPRGRRRRALAELAGALPEAELAVEDLGLRQPTLDDVFLTLTGAAPAPKPAAAAATPKERAMTPHASRDIRTPESRRHPVLKTSGSSRARPRAHAPPARGAGRRDHPARDVRAAVRVRLRRRDRRARRRRLQGVPDGRHLRPDDRLRLLLRRRHPIASTARTARSTASARSPSGAARCSAATPWRTSSRRCCRCC